ncbi:MAG: phage head spike fiber domain-containing protein, partial [Pyrinomonadaceae bacterium]
MATYTLDVNERCRAVRTAVHGQVFSCRMATFLGNGASNLENLSRNELRGPDGENQLRAGAWATKAMDASGNAILDWGQTQLNDLRIKIDPITSLGLGRCYFYSAWLELDIVNEPETYLLIPAENEVLVDTAPTLVWGHSVPETQKKFKLKIFTKVVAEGDGFDPDTSTQAVYTATASTSANTHKVSDGLLHHGEFYYVFVQTAVDFNGQDWWGEWNAGTIFKINAKPEVTVTAPVSPVIDTAKPIVQWSYDDDEGDPEAGFRIIILMKPFGGWPGNVDPEAESLTGDAEYDSGFIASIATEYALPVALTNGETFRAYIQVQQRIPAVLASEWSYLEFDTAFQAPPIPTVMAVAAAEAIEVSVVPSYPNLLSADGSSFETATGGWTTETNTTIAQSAAQFLDGTKSLALTRTTSTGTSLSKSAATTGGAPVIVGQTYTGSAYFRANTTSRSIRIDLEFIDASNAVIATSTGLADKVDINTGWTRQWVSGVAPANAVRVRMAVAILNAVVGEVHYVDQTSINLSELGGWTIGGGTIGLTLDPNSSAHIYTDNVLKPNQSSLETDAAGWFPWDANTTIARSVAQAQQGTASLLMTRVTSTGDARATIHRPPTTDNMLTAQQSSFETGISPWNADTNTTIAQSTVQELDGANSLAMTKTVAIGTAGAFSDVLTAGVTVQVGEVYTAAAYFRANTTARSVQVAIQWINAANGIISTSSGIAVTDANTEWRRA